MTTLSSFSTALIGSGNYIESACFGAGLWVIASGQDIRTSPNAINWTQRTSQFGGYAINCVRYANGLFVAVGYNGKISTSTDGMTWTARTSGVSLGFLAVAYGGGVWRAVGTNGLMMTSTDGTTWTDAADPAITITLNAVGYANGLWILGGDQGALYTSPDGITWSQQTSGFGTSPIYAIDHSTDQGMWLIGGGSGKLATSADAGVTWTQRTSFFGTYGYTVREVLYLPGLWIAAGYGGSLCTSPDGISWTLLNMSAIMSFSERFDALGFNGSDRLFAGGFAGKAGYATVSGIVWAPIQGVTQEDGLIPSLTVGVILSPTLGETVETGGMPIGIGLGDIYLHPTMGETIEEGLVAIGKYGTVRSVLIGETVEDGLAPSVQLRIVVPMVTGVVATRYRCVLTGNFDGVSDLELPISSLQARLKATGLSFLSVVVKGIDIYTDAIAARSSGYIEVHREYEQADGSVTRYLMVKVRYEDLQLYTGGKSGMTGQLSGTGSTLAALASDFALQDVTYYSLAGGKRRYRCALEPRLRPGDTATINGDTIVVGSIIYIIDIRSTFMEVAEG